MRWKIHVEEINHLHEPGPIGIMSAFHSLLYIDVCAAPAINIALK